MTEKYKAEDILNYLDSIDEKSFNQIYNQLNKKEREKVDRELEEYTEESSLNPNWMPKN